MASLLTGIIPYFIIIATVVAIHEAGHCAAAYVFKLKIREFSIGFGPAIWESHNAIGIKFKLRLIPLGGFIKVSDPNSNNKSGTDLLKSWQKIIFYAAGPIANLLSAAILLIILANMNIVKLEPAIIEKIEAGSGAEKAQILKGDQVINAGGAMITSSIDLITVAAITPKNSTIKLTIIRDGEKIEKDVVKKNGKFGVSFKKSKSLNTISEKTLAGTIRFITLTYNSIGFPIAIITSGQNIIDKMHGPVGIADMTGNVIMQTGSTLSLLLLGIQISIAMGVFNMIPLPVLDGGRIAFALYEGLSKSKISERMENVFNAMSVYIIIIVLIRITTKDLSAYF